ncbi:Aldose 1-epimerase [invertebrate metagenome]|uniref:aldose 1-epimerase n=1 Tax=invertebrate metagenome TaxID=1711999 RepID=A0A2H9TCH5_9ZZZZ
MDIIRKVFGYLPDGRAVDSFCLINDNRHSVTVLTLGGIIQSVQVPDCDGDLGEVILGCDCLSDYLSQHAYLGAIVGRYANRIAGGNLPIGRRSVQLDCNDGLHHLHGGKNGFSHRLWQPAFDVTENSVHLVLSLFSPDGDQHYPGTLQVKVTYQWNNDDELKLSYQAVTDQLTPVNLTNHSYFNLGHDNHCLNHQVQLFSDTWLPADKQGIPQGKMAEVCGTPMDLRQMTSIKEGLESLFGPIQKAGGFDHNWLIRGYDPQKKNHLLPVADVSESGSGRILQVYSTLPGVQFYTGNFLEGVSGRQGYNYPKHGGFCLETQFYPDSPHHPEFPSCWLKPGQIYDHKTCYRFGVKA